MERVQLEVSEAEGGLELVLVPLAAPVAKKAPKRSLQEP